MSEAWLSSCDVTTCVSWDGLVFIGSTNNCFESYHSGVITGSFQILPLSHSFVFIRFYLKEVL